MASTLPPLPSSSGPVSGPGPGRKRRVNESISTWRLTDRIGYAVMWAAGLLLCAIGIGIVAFMGFKGLQYLRPHLLQAQRQFQFVIEPFEVRKLLAYPPIQRRDQTHLMAQPPERLGQRRHHVGQPAALRVRVDLAAGEQEFHQS